MLNKTIYWGCFLTSFQNLRYLEGDGRVVPMGPKTCGKIEGEEARSVKKKKNYWGSLLVCLEDYKINFLKG